MNIIGLGEQKLLSSLPHKLCESAFRSRLALWPRKGIGMDTLLKVLIAVLVLYGGYTYLSERSQTAGATGQTAATASAQAAADKDKAFAMEELSKSTITIYGPEKSAMEFQIANEELHLWGLSCESRITNDMEDIKAQGLLEPLKRDGLFTDTGGKMPVIRVNDKFYSQDAFRAKLHKNPMTNSREKPEPYIVVYGLENCGRTTAVLDKLYAAYLPYEFRDFNDKANHPREYALIRGNDKQAMTPILDVNGHLVTTFSIEEVTRLYKETAILQSTEPARTNAPLNQPPSPASPS